MAHSNGYDTAIQEYNAATLAYADATTNRDGIAQGNAKLRISHARRHVVKAWLRSQQRATDGHKSAEAWLLAIESGTPRDSQAAYIAAVKAWEQYYAAS